MLKSGNFSGDCFTARKDCNSTFARRIVFAEAPLEFMGVDTGLQFESKFGFLFFDDEKRKDLPEHSTGTLTTGFAGELRSMVDVALGMIVDSKAAAELTVPCFDNLSVRHTYTSNDLPTDVVRGVASSDVGDPDVTLTVEQSSSVCNIHFSSLAVNDMSANSGNTQNGQSRTKQGESLGVRREQVPTAKAKICSELGRNIETPAEMIGGHHVRADHSTYDALTDCNTNYIFFRPHKDRNFVPIGGERQSVNQDAIVKLIGWAGNMTSSGPQFSGVLIA